MSTEFTFFVDAERGSNDADGLTEETALRTCAEATRRMEALATRRPPVSNSDTIKVIVLTDLPPSDPINGVFRTKWTPPCSVVLDGSQARVANGYGGRAVSYYERSLIAPAIGVTFKYFDIRSIGAAVSSPRGEARSKIIHCKRCGRTIAVHRGPLVMGQVLNYARAHGCGTRGVQMNDVEVRGVTDEEADRAEGRGWVRP